MFALFKDGKEVSKAHSRGIAAVTEAFERKVVVRCSSDFDSSTFTADLTLADGYEIREVFGEEVAADIEAGEKALAEPGERVTLDQLKAKLGN